ncbi:hypothetical protein RDWZM_007920 [Blomia tropicalis]|uniref:3-beta hydroxysteroid dehydrogenase/isomerase domain-containing protein n=1 Tax=Blomia tropicalis TaxID=40697 RepID=A0A9Q0M150_BLOTA|nr:hypothetical protein RDWZM_007920 [Blomia tropicalis]
MSMEQQVRQKQIVLVTGSSGCLGQHIVKQLHENDNSVNEIRCYDIRPYQNNLQHKIVKEMQITTADIGNERQLINAMKGVDVVIHCAALIDVGQYPNESEMQTVNVDGTQKVIDAAIECNVPYVVHISGTDVTIGYDPIYYGSENTTFIPKKHLLGAYSRTKYESEQIVADSNGRSLSNVENGNHSTDLMYGEEDAHFITSVLAIAKHHSGVLRRIDNVFTRIQPVYAGNVAVATIQAKEKLQIDDSVGGERFFITDDTKILDQYEFLEPYLQCRGYRLSNRSYPIWLFLFFLWFYTLLINAIWSVFPIRMAPNLTAANVRLLCTTHFFNRTKATLRLEYEPMYDHDEAHTRSIEYYKKVSLPGSSK